MKKSLMLMVLAGTLFMAGCVSQTQFLDSKQPIATQTALSRGQFELNCPEATSTLISREVVQPALQGPYVGGIQRAEFTVGVSGCGKRMTFVVICPEGGEGCYAAGPGRFHNW
jgi:PBP1b-binding outer membrane lipoprotein LpoB